MIEVRDTYMLLTLVRKLEAENARLLDTAGSLVRLIASVRAAAEELMGESMPPPMMPAMDDVQHDAQELLRSSLARVERPLTDRQIQILSLIARSASSHEIASRLHLSPQTVKNHRSHILKKLGVRTSTEAVFLAIQRGLLDAPERVGGTHRNTDPAA
jgi:DNA-binding NarL/FixJ family response regulator